MLIRMPRAPSIAPDSNSGEAIAALAAVTARSVPLPSAVPMTAPVRLSPPTAAAFAGGDMPFLDRPGVPPADKRAAGRWFFYALIGFLVGQLAGGVFGAVAGDVAGKNAAQMARITASTVPASSSSPE